MKSRRELHIDVIQYRYYDRNRKTLNEYCKNIIINDIEKLSGDEIKKTIIEHIKNQHYDRIKSVKMLSEHYRYFFEYIGGEFRICNDKQDSYWDRLSTSYTDSGVTRFRNQYDRLNDLKISNNESSLFKKEYTQNDEEQELVDILENMTNTKYNTLNKKYDDLKKIEDELLKLNKSESELI